MSTRDQAFALPAKLDSYLGALSKLMAQEGKRSLQELIVNAKVRVEQGWESERDFGQTTWGHAVYLAVPEIIFLRVAQKKDEIGREIAQGLNQLHHVRGEYVAAIFIEMDLPPADDWRRESGLQVSARRDVSSTAATRIWGSDGFRLFLSHKTSVKKEAADLKDKLSLFGFTVFVAHEDINPTKAWQDEIENALASMDGFVALLTGDYHDSDWTDQEVGYAIARGVPMLAIKLGLNPYGFIGRFQALSCDWNKAPVEIAKILIKNDRVFGAFVEALRKCQHFDDANSLASVLPSIERLDDSQIDELMAVYNENYEVRGGFGFNGSRPGPYGPGLVHYLNLHSKRKFKFSKDRFIELVRK
jgi:hypothetical protein